VTTENLSQLTLSQAHAALTSGQATSVELTHACLEQIQRHDEQVGAFLHIDKDLALQQAQASDARRAQGSPLSKLDGIPLALKDNILTQHMPTTAGSQILAGYQSNYDATVARKLEAAGAVILGKLNLDEFAMGSSNENSGYRLCRNPWDLQKAPGGSSGGAAAAVAAGMCFGALGTDTGGSIRQPAAFCGITGLKPTYGRVSRFGVVAYGSSLDQVGPMARDALGTAWLYEAISGFDPRDATSVEKDVETTDAQAPQNLQGLKIGVPKETVDLDGLDPAMAEALAHTQAQLKAQGATIVPISLPHTPYAIATYYIVATAEASSNLARFDGVRYGPRRGADESLDAMYNETRGQLFGQEVKRRILLGTYVLSAGYYDAYYLKALKARRKIADDFDQAFQEVDLILSPTTPTPAFSLGEKTADPLQMYLSDVFTISCNLAGIPGISINGGFSPDGLPLGMQLLGPAFSEKQLLETAHVLENQFDFTQRRPQWPAS